MRQDRGFRYIIAPTGETNMSKMDSLVIIYPTLLASGDQGPALMEYAKDRFKPVPKQNRSGMPSAWEVW